MRKLITQKKTSIVDIIINGRTITMYNLTEEQYHEFVTTLFLGTL